MVSSKDLLSPRFAMKLLEDFVRKIWKNVLTLIIKPSY